MEFVGEGLPEHCCAKAAGTCRKRHAVAMSTGKLGEESIMRWMWQ